MNTIDIKYNDEIQSFKELYELAREQFVRYEQVEGVDWNTYDFSIDCAEDQAKFKDMLQIRFIEELTEASVSLDEHEEHFWEEIGDALNFFLSAYTMLGVDFEKLDTNPYYYLDTRTPKHKPKTLQEYSVMVYPVIEKVGYLCNLLKNRPWAQSNYLVSLTDLDIRINELWTEFWKFLGELYLSSEDVYEMFYKKYMVNKHRIETGY